MVRIEIRREVTPHKVNYLDFDGLEDWDLEVSIGGRAFQRYTVLIYIVEMFSLWGPEFVHSLLRARGSGTGDEGNMGIYMEIVRAVCLICT